VPADTDWKPAVAEQLLTSFVAMREPLTLAIRASQGGIVWSIDCPHKNQPEVTAAVLALYPQADMTVTPVSPETYPQGVVARFCAPFYAPLTYAHELKASDPLAGIVGHLGNLGLGEVVVYALTLTPPQRNLQREGYQQMTRSGFNPLMLLTGVGILLAPFAAARREQKYDTKLHNLFQAKVQAPLSEVSFSIQVNSGRAEGLVSGLVAAAAVADRSEGNRLAYFPLDYAQNKKLRFTYAQSQRLVLTPGELATLWHPPSKDCQTPGIIWSTGAKAPLPRELHGNPGELLLGENRFQGVTRPVSLSYADRVTHINIIGKTRVGKTTLLQNLIQQDIAAGKGVGVIDPHGDLVQAILASSIPREREQDVVLFDLADTQHPVGLNLLAAPAGVSAQAAVSLTMGVLKKLFAEQWSATRMEDALYSALLALTTVPGATIRDLAPLFLDASQRAQVLKRVHDPVVQEFFEEDFGRLSERNQLEVARPILHRIRVFYRNPIINAIVCQPGSLDVRSLMDSGKIFLCSLAGHETQSEAGVIGSLLISKIQMAAMSRASLPPEQRRLFYLYIDEVQNFVTTSLSTMFSEAAKYALSLTVANQYLSQLEGGTLEAILGNTGTTVMFACGSQDAQDLGKYLKPVFDAQALMNLDRFQTIVRMQKGGKTLPVFSMQTRPGPAVPADAQERAERIRARSRATYALQPVAADESVDSPDVAVSPTPVIERDRIEHGTTKQRTNPAPASDEDPEYEEG